MANDRSESWGIAEQVRLLIHYGRGRTGEVVTIDKLLANINLSRQGLHNLLNGTSCNPRIGTLRSLCAFYKIPLAYFDCGSEAECLEFLARMGRLVSDDMAELVRISSGLSPRGQRSVISLLDMLESTGR
jgi:transcriptional regulator with XRE-family HTH domain